MRLLLGVVLGVFLTIGGAYLYDGAPSTGDETTGSVSADTGSRPMVNWDVVARNWHSVTTRIAHEWRAIAQR